MAAKERVVLVANWVDNISGNVIKSQRAIERFRRGSKNLETTTVTARKNITKFQQTFKGLGQQTKKNAELLGKTTDITKRVQQRTLGFAKVIGLSQKEYVNFNREGFRFNSIGGRAANTIRKTTQGFRGFKMELLSVMFFGLGMKKLFTGLLQPAFESAGIFKIWGTVLQILFLPVALKVLNWMLKILNFVTNLSPEMKQLAGTFALAGVAIGTMLFLIGSVGLGIGGLIATFGGLFAIVIGLLNPFTLLGAILIGIPLAAVSVSAASDVMGSTFKGLGGIVNNVFQTLLNKFPALRTGIESLSISTRSLSDAWDDVKKIAGTWITDFLEEHPGIAEKITELKDKFIGVKDSIKGVVEWFGKLGTKIIGLWETPGFQDALKLIAKLAGGAGSIVKDLLVDIPKGIGGTIAGVENKIRHGSFTEEEYYRKLGITNNVTNNVSIPINATINSSTDLDQFSREIGTAVNRGIRQENRFAGE